MLLYRPVGIQYPCSESTPLPWDPVSLWGIGVGSCFVLLSPSQRVKSSLKPAVDWLKGGAKLAGALDDVISSALLDHG